MSTEWHKIENRIKGVIVERMPAKDLLDLPLNEELEAAVPFKDVEATFDAKRLMLPLGDYWKVMAKHGDVPSIKDALLKYWAYKGMPKVLFEFADIGGAALQLRSKLIQRKDDEDESRVIDLNKVIEGVNRSFDYDRTVIGSDGARLEFQFLSKKTRREVLPGDFVDGGLFVSINGRVKVSAGINRLVCTNGMTERLNVMSGIDFSGASEMLERSVRLINWLAEQTTHKVAHIRELSVALKDYPKPVLNRFWKTWSEACDAGDLTYFDVINDLTASVNKTLTPIRYRMLQSYETINAYQVAEHKCPVCSAKVGK